MCLQCVAFQLHDITHPNIARFIGASVSPDPIQLITEYCSKGSLQVCASCGCA